MTWEEKETLNRGKQKTEKQKTDIGGKGNKTEKKKTKQNTEKKKTETFEKKRRENGNIYERKTSVSQESEVKKYENRKQHLKRKRKKIKSDCNK